MAWRGSGWRDAQLRVHHVDRPEDALWHTLPGASFVAAASGETRIHETRGSFTVREQIDERCLRQAVDVQERQGDALRLSGRLACEGGHARWSLELAVPREPGQLRLVLEVAGRGLDRATLSWAREPGERFFGFGQQFTHFDLSGRLVPIWVSEQGIGRGRQPLTALVDAAAGSGGAWHTSYAPVPYFQTNRGRGLFLESSEYAVFDLRRPARAAVSVLAPRFAARVLAGADPLERLTAYTEYAGRMPALPFWVHGGAILGLQGGTERVREVLALLEDLGTPVAAVWLQDWVGQRTTSFGQQLWWNWELDRERYPGWEDFVLDLAARGVRVLTYVNPFLVDVSEKPGVRRNLLEEAREAGYLVRRPDGSPYFVTITDFEAALVDLTLAEARTWMMDILREEVLGIGASGWMADFGEALPVDAVLAGGESAASFHNRYPEEWARINRAAVEAAGRAGDVVFFTRSGYTRSPGFSTLFWEGDQIVAWDRHDGIKSAVTGLLSGGLSGFALNHSDIGGYTTIDRFPVRLTRSRELLWRWTELAAFQTIFRSHEGNLPAANHQLDSDAETLEHFARFAKIHAAWAFYREELLGEASERGWPVVRHPFLHQPDEPAYQALDHQQFQVGRELWVAPVLDPGAREVEIRLPAGRWVHALTGAVHESEGPARPLRLAAPLGQPAVLYREGSAVGERFRRELLEVGALRP